MELSKCDLFLRHNANDGYNDFALSGEWIGSATHDDPVGGCVDGSRFLLNPFRVVNLSDKVARLDRVAEFHEWFKNAAAGCHHIVARIRSANKNRMRLFATFRRLIQHA